MASDPFDPVDWLRRFTAAGGYYMVQGDKVNAGWKLLGNPHDEAARETWREIEDREDRRALIRAAVLSR